MVMIRTCAKKSMSKVSLFKRQSGNKRMDRRTDEQMNTTDHITFTANAVGNDRVSRTHPSRALSCAEIAKKKCHEHFQAECQYQLQI